MVPFERIPDSENSLMDGRLRRWHPRAWVIAVVSLFLIFVFWSFPSTYTLQNSSLNKNSSKTAADVESWCPLPEKPKYPNDGLSPSFLFADKASVDKQVKRLSAAVNVPTVSYDDNGDVGKDERWQPFYKFHEVLEDLFPLVHENLELSVINDLGLLYTLKGSSKDLKPILFAAHQDVVPASSPDKWAHPPYDAHFDGKWLWGRGSSDCKNNLIGILSVVENLLEQNWQPKRTILLAFGYDEETGGVRGATEIAKELQKRYGKHGVAMVMDEGGMGIEAYGDDYAYALPAVAEKGFLDVYLKLEVDGGHSSRPPAHSGIGIMAEMIVALEKNPFKPRLTKQNPFRGFLECQVRYSPRDVEGWLKEDLIRGENEATIGSKLADSRGEEVRFSLQTSQAVDIIKAGEKTNQLPEEVTAVINFRIAPQDSIISVKKSVANVLVPIAKKYGVTVRGFGHDEEVPKGAPTLHITSKDDLSPSPISYTGPDSKVWNVFSGTLRQVFEDVPTLKGKTVVPAGDIMTGNTDTIHYWDVSQNIYRFSPARNGTRLGIHTINERIDMNAHIEGMRVYYSLMRNFDRADV